MLARAAPTRPAAAAQAEGARPRANTSPVERVLAAPVIARVLASITAMAGAYNVQKNARDKRLSVGTSESRCRRGPARRLEKKCNFEISYLGFSEELGHDLGRF